MATKTVDIQLSVKSTGDGAQKTVAGLKAVQDQANKTRESMAKLTEVGSKLALVGGAMVAPFALAMKKYIDTAKESEPLSRRMVELSKKWEESQIRLGRITAEIVLPTLEKGADILEGVIDYAEKNPDVVRAALTIGGSLILLGSIATITAQTVSTLATIQGLLAAAGFASGAGGAAGAVGTTGAGVAAGGGLSAAVASGITIAVPVIVGALALAIGAPIGLGLGNALAGTNRTMDEVLETGRQLFVISKYFYTDYLPKLMSNALQNLGKMIGNALMSLGTYLKSLFLGGKASGGYMDAPGLYTGAERGREFVLNAPTTRAAERAVGGRLNQQTAASYMTNNVNLSNGMTIVQQKRAMAANNRKVKAEMLNLLLGGA